MRDLTQRQRQILEFVYEFFLIEHQTPPCQFIADFFDFSSANAAYEHLVALERKGYLEKNICGKWRFSRKMPFMNRDIDYSAWSD